MAEDVHLFDTSEYPKKHLFHSKKNMRVPGKMKDECALTPISECQGLRPKKRIKKVKGVTLETPTIFYRPENRIVVRHQRNSQTPLLNAIMQIQRKLEKLSKTRKKSQKEKEKA